MSLDIKIYQRKFQPHAGKAIQALLDGFKRHGVKAEWMYQGYYKPSDLAVIWGVRFPNIIQGQKEHSGDYLVLERGYFKDRMNYFSLGYNGLNGRAEFHAENSPPDRWEKHGVEVKPWKTDGKYILLMGQVSGDQSLQGINLRIWYQEVIDKVKTLTDMPIFFRPHPLARQQEIGLDCDRYERGPLIESLQDAYLVITFNSNTGVDAVLNGIPAIAMDRGSMAWDMAQHGIIRDRPDRTEWSYNLERITPDRTQWLYDLGYKQWLPEEIASGEAWAHLKRRYA